MKFAKNKKKFVLISVLFIFLGIVLGYFFFNSFFITQKTADLQKTSTENTKESLNFSVEDTAIMDTVVEKSLTDYFNKNSNGTIVAYSYRDLPVEYLQTLPTLTSYSLKGVDYIRQLAYLKQVVKDEELYKFDLVSTGLVDVRYSSEVKLFDADYGFDSSKNLMRTEFFPVDNKNINLLKVGAPVYVVYTKDQEKNVILNPKEIVVLNYE